MRPDTDNVFTRIDRKLSMQEGELAAARGQHRITGASGYQAEVRARQEESKRLRTRVVITAEKLAELRAEAEASLAALAELVGRPATVRDLEKFARASEAFSAAVTELEHDVRFVESMIRSERAQEVKAAAEAERKAAEDREARTAAARAILEGVPAAELAKIVAETKKAKG